MPLLRNDALSPSETLARTLDPCLIARDAGLPELHPEQVRVLRHWRRDVLALWSRQSGKSLMAAIAAVHQLLFPSNPEHTPTVVIVARAERQSSECFRKAKQVYSKLSYAPPLRTDAATAVEIPSGGRIVCYPGSEEGVRGLSAVGLAVIDEASLCERELVDAISPMLSTTGGPLWCLGTGRAGENWFREAWENPALDRIVLKSHLPWDKVPHIDKAFVEKERARMPSWQFSQEYEAQFVDAGESILISRETILAAVNPEERALW